MPFREPPFLTELDTVNMWFPAGPSFTQYVNTGSTTFNRPGISSFLMQTITGGGPYSIISVGDAEGYIDISHFINEHRFIIGSAAHVFDDPDALCGGMIGRYTGTGPLGSLPSTEPYIAGVMVLDTVRTWKVLIDDGQGGGATTYLPDPGAPQPTLPPAIQSSPPVPNAFYNVGILYNGASGEWQFRVDGVPLMEGMGPSIFPSSLSSDIMGYTCQSGNDATAYEAALVYAIMFRQLPA